MKHPWELGGHKSVQNIKYCNDNPQCEKMARSHDLFELRRMVKENDQKT